MTQLELVKHKATKEFPLVLKTIQKELLENGFSFKKPQWEEGALKDLPNEIWRKVYRSNNYLVSNYSRIKSLLNNIILKQYFDAKGYLYVSIEGKKDKIHRLVARSFCMGYGSTKQVNHVTGYKWLNIPIFLEWTTAAKNQIHAYETGLKPKFFGKDNYASMPVIQYSLTGEYIKKWESMKIAERELGIDDAPISKCCKGNINYKQAYGFIWRFEGGNFKIGRNLLPSNIPLFSKPKFSKRRATTIANKKTSHE